MSLHVHHTPVDMGSDDQESHLGQTLRVHGHDRPSAIVT